MGLIDLFDLTLKASADRAALEFEGREWTFGELEANSNRLASYLATRGVHEGDRLAVYLTNCTDLILAYLGSVCTFLNPS